MYSSGVHIFFMCLDLRESYWCWRPLTGQTGMLLHMYTGVHIYVINHTVEIIRIKPWNRLANSFHGFHVLMKSPWCIKLLTYWTSVHKMLYGLDVSKGHSKLIIRNFLQSVQTTWWSHGLLRWERRLRHLIQCLEMMYSNKPLISQ